MTMKLFDLRGRTAFVPGGYGGIGAAISRGLAKAGAKVVIAGRDGTKARELAKRIGRGARGVGLDVEDVPAIRDAVDGIRRVDILVNCVGIQVEQALTQLVFRHPHFAASWCRFAALQAALLEQRTHASLIRSRWRIDGNHSRSLPSDKGEQIIHLAAGERQ